MATSRAHNVLNLDILPETISGNHGARLLRVSVISTVHIG